MTDTTPQAGPEPAPTAATRASGSGLRRYRRVLAVLTLAVAAWGLVWAVVTPTFRSPDEQNHVNSVLRIAHGGGWPAPGDAYIAPVVALAVEEAAYPADAPGRWVHRDDQRQLVDVVPVPRPERARVDAANAIGGPASGTEVDQMTQHPPLYYALGAAVLHATGLTEARWDVTMLALRLLDVVLLALVVPLAAESARRVTGSPSAGLVAAAFPLFLPQLGHVMGAVNNDALVVLTCAVVTYLAARVVTGDLRWRVVVALGVAIGLGLLVKVMAAFTLPTVLVAYLLARGARPWARLGRAVAVGLIALAVGGWWWVRNVVTLGAVQPVGRPRDLTLLATVPDAEVPSTIAGRLAQSFFGNLSWLEIHLPGAWVVGGSAALTAAGLVALAVPGARRAAAALLLLPTALAAGVAFNAWDLHAETGVLVAIQGRYVFGGVTALAVVVGIAVWQVVRRSERRLAAAVPVAVGLGLAAAGGGLAWAFRAFYLGPGESVGDAVDRWLAWSPLEAVPLQVLLGLAAVTGVAALGVAVAWAYRSPHRLAAPRPGTGPTKDDR
ncbi:DUF2142 domain-containing protein [Isoptericola sp. NEAU-Y5]|uniref:DUF2142 domain-containing protein n=1 Tax=Isoptericola luteus TaxID=2879484 RepID=A0ABS7ZCL2_9MICO|nr:DUF2142 domain-containing protein [Isoptericola sp. NEAU-Y5]MCA5892778.1 DUF2142 domain-containing protein [Isoptericola sp. NEAU-Y5]